MFSFWSGPADVQCSEPTGRNTWLSEVVCNPHPIRLSTTLLLPFNSVHSSFCFPYCALLSLHVCSYSVVLCSMARLLCSRRWHLAFPPPTFIGRSLYLWEIPAIWRAQLISGRKSVSKHFHGWTTWGKTQDKQNMCDSVGSVCQVHLLSPFWFLACYSLYLNLSIQYLLCSILLLTIRFSSLPGSEAGKKM